MHKLALLVSLLVAACGSPKPAPATPTAAAASHSTLTPVDGALAMTLQARAKYPGPDSLAATLVFKADGTVSASSATKPLSVIGNINAQGELRDPTGKVFAKLAPDNTMSVLHESEERRDGKVVRSDSAWNVVGTLGADGTFIGQKDQTKLAFGTDGEITGLPDGMSARLSGASADHKREGMFLLVASLAGGKSISDTSASTAPAATPPKP